jgi:hypothetical protein
MQICTEMRLSMLKLSSHTNRLPQALIVPGDLCAGNRFPESVRTLVEETIPQVREPPENSREF